MDDYVIDIENATVVLGDGPVLKDVFWRARRGEHQFVIGANGSGKTTLMRLALGYVWPLHGAKVRVLGETYGKCDLFALRRRTAWVSPFLREWTGTGWRVLEVVVSGVDASVGLYRKPTESERSKASSLLAGMDCDRLVERRFSDLSSGEKMKILIARALMSEPELMIFDEACVHLDLKSRERVLKAVEDITSAPAAPLVVFVSQRIEDVLPVFANGIILKEGSVFGAGEASEILTEDNLSSAFDVRLSLSRSPDGRIWPRVIG